MTELYFQQLFEKESSTYTYLLADTQTKEAVIIDPVLETVERDLKLIKELGFSLKYVLDTHVHADHITGSGRLKEHTQCQICISEHSGADCADVYLRDGEIIKFGSFEITAIQTPGHTNGCMSYYIEKTAMVFTGDSLLIRSNGRTDFQQGDAKVLYDSITQKLFALPEETILFPGHDYKGMGSSTIGLEKKYNTRINEKISKEDFVKIMSELKLDNPKKIHQAVPANLKCGNIASDKYLTPQNVDGVPEVTVQVVQESLGKVMLVDVRRREELHGELGYIDGVVHIELGPELMIFLQKEMKNKEIVFVCRSGARSGQATMMSRQMGFTSTYNMQGGMISWNQFNFAVKR